MVLPEQPLEPNAYSSSLTRQGSHMTISFSIGIDVGKYKLDVGTKDRYLGKFDNTDAGHDKLISKLHGLGDIKNICIESI